MIRGMCRLIQDFQMHQMRYIIIIFTSSAIFVASDKGELTS